MKTILRIFNFVFMAISVVAIVLLFAMPTMSLNIGYKVTAEQIQHVIPENEETKDLDVKKIIGGDTIDLGLSLSVTPKAMFRSVTGDSKTVIDEEFVDPNINSVIESLRNPIHRIAKGLAKQLAVKTLIKNFDEKIEENKDSSDTRSAADIRAAAGMDEAYFENLTDKVFAAIDTPNASVITVGDVMFEQLQDAAKKMNSTGVMEIPEFDATYKASVRSSTASMLSDANMLKEDEETIYPFDVIVDGMLVDLIRSDSATEGETMEEKAAKLPSLLSDMIKKNFNDDVYNAIALVLKIMLIVIIVVVAIWAFFLVWTLIRTFFGGDKVYTFTGPHFWISGVLQILLGVVLTIGTSIALAKLGSSGLGGGAFANMSASIVTSMFIPSILVLICIPLTSVYTVFKSKYKRELKAAPKAE